MNSFALAMFLIGFILGGIFGVFMMCLAQIAKEADRKMEDD